MDMDGEDESKAGRDRKNHPPLSVIVSAANQCLLNILLFGFHFIIPNPELLLTGSFGIISQGFSVKNSNFIWSLLFTTSSLLAQQSPKVFIRHEHSLMISALVLGEFISYHTPLSTLYSTHVDQPAVFLGVMFFNASR